MGSGIAEVCARAGSDAAMKTRAVCDRDWWVLNAKITQIYEGTNQGLRS
jgi:alkylation response protein AidB-like acyl-CoA dehydrogenase